MKKIAYLLTSGLLLLAFAFNIGCKTEPKAVEEPIPAANYSAYMVTIPVSSFDTFKTVFLSLDSLRTAYGITRKTLGRGTDDPNLAVVFNSATDLAKAKEFSNLPEVNAAREAGTVTGTSTFYYMNVIRIDTTVIPQNDRVLLSHKVNDFDAWLKVYDEEGKSGRAAHGLIDRGMARDASDPNIVYIAFAISDKEKAMARMQSEDLKTLMTNAGVAGPPNILFYTLDK